MVTAIPQLIAEVPGAPRTETRAYGDTRRPFTAPLPDLDTASPDQIDDMAANVLQLPSDLYAVCASPSHVGALALRIHRLSVDRDHLESRTTQAERTAAIVQGVCAVLSASLEREREAVRLACEMVCAEQSRSADLREANRKLQEDNAALSETNLDRLCRVLELESKLYDRERLALEAAFDKATTTITGRRFTEVSAALGEETKVVDADGGGL